MSLRDFPDPQTVHTLVDLRPLVDELWATVQNLQARVEALEGGDAAQPAPQPAPPAAG
jgi:hypothetical protein